MPTTLTAALLVSLAIAACGGSGHRSSASSQLSADTAATGATTGTDARKRLYVPPPPKDNDADLDPKSEPTGYYDGDDRHIRTFGHAAGSAEWRQVTALVKRYYAAMLAHDGTTACPLIYSQLEEAIPEDYGQPPGPPYARGKTCAVVMTKIFTHQPRAGTATIVITGVRVRRNSGYALLKLKGRPPSFAYIKRERGIWKVNSLLLLGPMP